MIEEKEPEKIDSSRLLGVIMVAFVGLVLLHFLPPYGIGQQSLLLDNSSSQTCQIESIESPKADVSSYSSWYQDSGHKYMLNISNIPDGDRVIVSRNGNQIESIKGDVNLTYKPNSGDRFVTEQISDGKRKELTSINIQ